jgi:hypothetical protein
VAEKLLSNTLQSKALSVVLKSQSESRVEEKISKEENKSIETKKKKTEIDVEPIKIIDDDESSDFLSEILNQEDPQEEYQIEVQFFFLYFFL